MEILTHKKVYQLVGDETSGSNECVTKFEAMAIASDYRKSITTNLSSYFSNECIDVLAVEDKADLSNLKFAINRFNPSCTATTLKTTAISLDIDGHVIDYTATADVDWITDISVSGDAITFKVARNTGSQRTGHITGINSAGKSDSITIVQEAYEAALKYTYKIIAKNAEGVPNIVINGEPVTPSLQDGDYVYEYVLRAASESESLASVPFTITNGGATSWTENPSIAVTPSTWDLGGGLTGSFTVTYSETLREKAWSIASGTIPREGSTTTTLTLSSRQQSPSIAYTITDNAPSGSSFSYNKSGMSFSATASGTSAASSTINVSYNGATASINVIYIPVVLGPFYRWKSGSSITYNTDGTVKNTLTYQVYYTKDGVEQDVTDYVLTPGGRDVLYSTEPVSGTETVEGTGLTWTWTQEANARVPVSAIIITEGESLSQAGGTVKYIATWRWHWKVGKDTAYLVGSTSEITYTYSENKSTDNKTHYISEKYDSSYDVFDNYGLSYPDATTTLTQPGYSTVYVLVSVSAQQSPTNPNYLVVTVKLSRSIPFTIVVSGAVDWREHEGGVTCTSTYICRIGSGETSDTCIIQAGADVTNLQVLGILLDTINPTEKRVDGVIYKLIQQS